MKFYTTDRLRKEYLVENLFVEGEMRLAHTHQDRVILGGVVPTHQPLKIEAPETTKTDFFLERRELGVMNVVPTGTVIADDYSYFGCPDDARSVYCPGRPEETRPLVVSNEQAVISPPWSIHSSVGTNKYFLIWAMAGENTCYTDLDKVDIRTLR